MSNHRNSNATRKRSLRLMPPARAGVIAAAVIATSITGLAPANALSHQVCNPRNGNWNQEQMRCIDDDEKEDNQLTDAARKIAAASYGWLTETDVLADPEFAMGIFNGTGDNSQGLDRRGLGDLDPLLGGLFAIIEAATPAGRERARQTAQATNDMLAGAFSHIPTSTPTSDPSAFGAPAPPPAPPMPVASPPTWRTEDAFDNFVRQNPQAADDPATRRRAAQVLREAYAAAFSFGDWSRASEEQREELRKAIFEDTVSLSRYTTSTYRPINSQLRTGGTLSEDHRQLVDGVERLVRAAPPLNMNLFRGGAFPDAFAAQIERGDDIVDAGFTSSSVEQSIADGFARIENGVAQPISEDRRRIMLEIESGGYGVLIVGAHANPREREVLFAQNQRFVPVRDSRGRPTSYVRTFPTPSGGVEEVRVYKYKAVAPPVRDELRKRDQADRSGAVGGEVGTAG